MNSDLELPVVEPPANSVLVPVIGMATDPTVLQPLHKRVCVLPEFGAGLLAQRGCDTARDDHHLDLSHVGGQDQSSVVSVHHGHDPNGPGGDSPAVLVGKEVLPAAPRVLKLNLKHLGEILAKMVRCRGLQGNTKQHHSK